MSFRIDFNSLVNDFPDARSRETNGQRRGIFSLLFFFSRCNSEHERLSEELIVICEGGEYERRICSRVDDTRKIKEKELRETRRHFHDEELALLFPLNCVTGRVPRVLSRLF